MNGKPSRELTREERREIKQLVTSMCANYDREHGCLPLDYGRCYMLDKCWMGGLCKYFRDAVLPLNPALEASLLNEDATEHTKACVVCGAHFKPSGRAVYCSGNCRLAGSREKERNKKRKQRRK